jgi:hypothetical protein
LNDYPTANTGVIGWARRRRRRAVLTGLVLAVAASALACGPVRPAGGQPQADRQPADPIELLLTSAATDFRAQRPPRPVSFRNVRSGYLVTSEGVRQYRLCGEFLTSSGEGRADWTLFATIQTSPYEQWLGQQALHFCKDPAMKWQEVDLSSLLLSRFKADR